MERLPVVVIHGSLRTMRSVAPMCNYLRRHGFDARVFGYRTREDTLHQNAQALSAFVERQFGRRRTSMGFVTHSFGALVVRRYLADFARDSEMHSVFMIAPPNRGATLAAKVADLRLFSYLYGKTAKEVQPAEAANIPWLPESARVRIVAGGRANGRGFGWWLPGSHDGIVTFDDTRAPLASAPEPIFVGGLHGILPYRRKVWRMAAEFLREEP
jgi:triacylglycerol esterase/lipase EstA (alpha/beta hydrolase family)